MYNDTCMLKISTDHRVCITEKDNNEASTSKVTYTYCLCNNSEYEGFSAGLCQGGDYPAV